MRNLYPPALGSHKLTPAVKSPQAKATSSTLSSAELRSFSEGPARPVCVSQEAPEARKLALPQLPQCHLLGEEKFG